MLPALLHATDPAGPAPGVQEQLAGAFRQLKAGAGSGSKLPLRVEQARVFSAFGDYLGTRLGASGPTFCRIVLPPRTGKTVIAGHIIGRTALPAAIIVPTRVLAEQTCRLLKGMLPGTAVGVFTGERKEVPERGVTVTTYAMLQRLGPSRLPPALRRSPLVFVDEAHRAMSAGRMRVLREGFDPAAVQIALTATPDYDARRRLQAFFPDLIHELSLAEALELELLAPTRVWIAQVDVDGSRVRLTGGDYEPRALGRLMTAAPIFEAATRFRYEGSNSTRGALMCCATRQQASDLTQWLRRHRPAGSASPGLVLGDTDSRQREELLARFEAGELDTLVQVGVLVEGWSSPRCKVLVDLAPSLSRVRATQKYFRAMTRDGGAEARLYVLVPVGLRRPPVLPTDLLLPPGGEYHCGELLGAEAGSSRTPPKVSLEALPVAGVRLMQRILLEGRLRRPTLRRGDLAALRRVLRSCSEFDLENPGGRRRFEALLFRHRLYSGSGRMLLQWLGYSPSAEGYRSFLQAALPEAAGTFLLQEEGTGEYVVCDRPCIEDVEQVEAKLAGFGFGSRAIDAGQALQLLAAGAHREGPHHELQRRRDLLVWLGEALNKLSPRLMSVMELRFGLCGEPPHTLDELGVREEVSVERARSLVNNAVRRMWMDLGGRLPARRRSAGDPPRVYTRPPPPPSRGAVRLAERVARELEGAGTAPLTLSELSERLGLETTPAAAALQVLLRQERVLRTTHGYLAQEPEALQGLQVRLTVEGGREVYRAPASPSTPQLVSQVLSLELSRVHLEVSPEPQAERAELSGQL